MYIQGIKLFFTNKLIMFVIITASLCPLSLSAQMRIRVGFYENPPKIFTDKNGNAAGFWADITNAIAEKENWDIKWVHGSWAECLKRLDHNTIDVMVDVGETPERRKKFLFSRETVLLSWAEIYTRGNTSLRSLLDLGKKKIAGLKGSFNLNGPGSLRDILHKLYIKSTLVELDSYDEVFSVVQSGKVFAGITNNYYGAFNAGRYHLTRAPLIFHPARVQFAVSKKNADAPYLEESIDKAVRIMKKTGGSIYYRSIDRYFFTKEVVTVFPRWLFTLVIVFLFLAAAAVTFILLLRYKVKKKTLQLRESLVHYKNLFDDVPASVWEEDVTGLVSFLTELPEKGELRPYLETHPEFLKDCLKRISVLNVNKSSLSLFQAESRDDLMLNFDKTLTPQAFDVFKKVVLSIAEGKTTFQSEAELNTLTGQTIFVYFRLEIPVSSGTPDYGHALLVMVDSTKEKAQEENLRTLSTVVKQSPNSIVITDTAGSIEYVNPAFCRLTGYTPEEVRGKNPRLLQSGRTPVQTYKELWNTVLSGSIWEGMFINRKKNGEIYYEQVTISPVFNEKGVITRLLWIKKDITEQKKTEEELDAYRRSLETMVNERTEKLEITNKKLEYSNRELESFSYSVSHDLRSPLRAIKGFTEMLTEGYADRLDEEGKRLVNVIQVNTRKMGQLIEDLLKFSRLGRAAMKFTNVNMRVMASAVFYELTAGKEHRSIEFTCENLPEAWGDREFLHQVWMNLLSNAIKFTSHRKQPRISVSSTAKDGSVVYCVKDNGAGFDMKYKDKLFTVFQRLHREKEFPGTGVGLALVQRIIARHDGKIWGEGEPDKGASFYFSLPVKHKKT